MGPSRGRKKYEFKAWLVSYNLSGLTQELKASANQSRAPLRSPKKETDF